MEDTSSYVGYNAYILVSESFETMNPGVTAIVSASLYVDLYN